LLCRPPASLRIGILALGVLGKAAAAAFQHASFRFADWNRSPKKLEGVTAYSRTEGLNTLLHESDIIVLLPPLTGDTCGLVNKIRFAAMKKERL